MIMISWYFLNCITHPRYYLECISHYPKTCWQKLYNAFIRIVNSDGVMTCKYMPRHSTLKANFYNETINVYSNNKTKDYQIFNS